MENSCTHGFHTRLFGKITALEDALFLFMQESTGFLQPMLKRSTM